MSNDRLEALLDAYFDEMLGETERGELEYLLLSSPQARQLFWQRARFHALLRRYGTEYWGNRLAEQYAASELTDTQIEPASASVQGTRKRWAFPEWFSSGLRWATAGAVALVALIAGLLWWRPAPQAPSAGIPAMESAFRPPVAELVRAVGVEWESATNAFSPGAVLTAGSLKLKRGLVELGFYQGARVVIEGPAEFELISDMEARCASGKIRVEVPPPAHGFKVLSPNLQVVDVGTSFGLEVRNDGQAEIHVFQGKVEMASAAAPQAQQALTEGQSAHVSASGQIQSVELDATTFVSLEEIQERSHEEMRHRYAAWQDFSQLVLRDPALLLYYDFEGQPSNARVLPNCVPAAPTESNGTIIGCQRAEGRWPGKGALDFKQFGDRVRFALPGRFTSLTCLAWVRVDGLSHRLSALMMSGKARAGEPQWQLVQTGTIQFGKRILDGWGVDHMENCQSVPLIAPEAMGLWMHLGVVYDLPTRTVKHFFNGQEVSRGDIVSQLPVTLEAMEIGNWTPQVGQPMEPIRSFNGRLDEFAIFSRALSAEEIQEAFAIGRPL